MLYGRRRFVHRTTTGQPNRSLNGRAIPTSPKARASGGPILKTWHIPFVEESPAVRRYATQLLSSSARFIVLALTCAIPVTAGLPPCCAGHSNANCEGQSCCSESALLSVKSSTLACLSSGCQHDSNRETITNLSRCSSPCCFSAACDCPAGCDCRQGIPTPGRSREYLDSHSQILLTFKPGPGFFVGSMLCPTDGLRNDWCGPVATAARRCALLCRFLA